MSSGDTTSQYVINQNAVREYSRKIFDSVGIKLKNIDVYLVDEEVLRPATRVKGIMVDILGTEDFHDSYRSALMSGDRGRIDEIRQRIMEEDMLFDAEISYNASSTMKDVLMTVAKAASFYHELYESSILKTLIVAFSKHYKKLFRKKTDRNAEKILEAALPEFKATAAQEEDRSGSQ